MLEYREFLLYARLDPEVLEAWVDAGWILPRRQAGGMAFTEADLARAELIRDLKEDLGVNDDGIGIVLGLLDQLHGARRTLRSLIACLNEQPEETRTLITAMLASFEGLEDGPVPERRRGTSDEPAGG